MPAKMHRIIFTGSRHWMDYGTIRLAVGAIEAHLFTMHGGSLGPYVCVHGAQRGLDTLAAEVVTQRRRSLAFMSQVGYWAVEPHPADTVRYGVSGFTIRNTEMCDAGATLCVGFPETMSRGTIDCMRKARARGIMTWNFGVPLSSDDSIHQDARDRAIRMAQDPQFIDAFERARSCICGCDCTDCCDNHHDACQQCGLHDDGSWA